MNKNKKFDKKLAEEELKKLLKKYKIHVYKYSTTSCGIAWFGKQRRIKIPKPTNIDRFGVCMHEIKHIIDQRNSEFGKRVFEREYACDKFALEKIRELGFDDKEWVLRMRWHITMMISKAYCRKLNLDTIFKDLLKDIDLDIEEWRNKNIFISIKPKDEREHKYDFETIIN